MLLLLEASMSCGTRPVHESSSSLKISGSPLEQAMPMADFPVVVVNVGFAPNFF